MKNLLLFGLFLFAFGCSTTGQFTRAKTTGRVISPSETKSTSSGAQKLISEKNAQINKVPNGLIIVQKPTLEAYSINSRNFEDPPKGATLLNQANHRNISQNFANKNTPQNNPPKSDKDIVNRIEFVNLDEDQNSGVRIYWFRLLLFYLVMGIFAWIIYSSVNKEANPFNSKNNPFRAKTPSAPSDSSSGGGI